VAKYKRWMNAFTEAALMEYLDHLNKAHHLTVYVSYTGNALTGVNKRYEVMCHTCRRNLMQAHVNVVALMNPRLLETDGG
jgi:hypothetical protein